MGKTAILVVLAATLGSTLLMYNAKESAFEGERRQVDYQEEQLAKEIARAGYNLALGKVKRDYDSYKDLPGQSAEYQDGQYHLASSGEGRRATIEATGEYHSKEYTIEGKVEEIYPPNAAVYVDGSSVSANYYGNSFIISGEDTAPPSIGSAAEEDLSTTSRAVVAREPSVAKTLIDGLASMQYDNVYGQKPEADIYHGEPYFDLEKLVNDAQAAPDEYYEGDQQFNGSDTFGSADAPVVVVVDGNATMSGNATGYGLLLVEGDLSLAAGNFTWEGIVIAYGDVGVSVDYTGNAKVYGSVVMIPDQFDESEEEGTVNFEIGGNARIQYSSQAIERLVPVLDTFEERVLLLSEQAY